MHRSTLPFAAALAGMAPTVGALGLLVVVGCASEPPAVEHQAFGDLSGPQPKLAAEGPRPAPTPCPAIARWLPEIPTGAVDPPLVEVTDPELLSPFFERVARLLRGLADDHVRIAVYGDSNLTMDHLSGRMRRTLQLRYGDAGHGFVALGRPWSHYLHMDVRHDAAGFVSYAVSTAPVPDGAYGMSGIAAESLYGGAKSWIATAHAGAPIGTTASRFEVFFMRGPSWGTFDVIVDHEKHTTVDSSVGEPGVGVHPFELEDAPHHVAFVATDRRRRVRLLGATLERGTPSFVVDAFGVGAMNTRSQARADPAISRPMLERRGYDLVIFATGANDVFTLDVTPHHLADLIERHRQALPGAPILLLTPADRGKEKTFPPTLAAVEQRRAIAKQNRVALWDLFLAMGGKDSMRGFKQRGLAKSDYIHFNEEGGGYMGDRLVYALFSGLWKYVDAHPKAGCEGPVGAPPPKKE